MANEATSSSIQKVEEEGENEEPSMGASSVSDALPWCDHLHLLLASDLSHIPSPDTLCSRCHQPDENWLCLCCKDVLCSRFVNKHMLEHFQETNHCLVLSYCDFSVWCFACDAYLDVQIIRQLQPVHALANKLKNGEASPFRTIEYMQESQAKKAITGHRTKNFANQEDECIVKAWSAVGRNDVEKMQTGATMWERILKAFNGLMGKVTDRSSNGLMCRWHVIQDAVVKFSEFLLTVEKQNRDGMSSADRIFEAKQMYCNTQNAPFKFESCWLILKDSPKWKEHVMNKGKTAKKQKPNAVADRSGFLISGVSSASTPPILTETIPIQIPLNSEPVSPNQNLNTYPQGRATDTPPSSTQTTPSPAPFDSNSAPLSPDQNRIPSPIQRVAEKVKRKKNKCLKQTGIMQEFLNTFQATLKNQDEIALREIQLKEQRVRMRQYKEDDKIMEKDLSGLNSVQQQFFAARQREIWERWNREGRFSPGQSGGEFGGSSGAATRG